MEHICTSNLYRYIEICLYTPVYIGINKFSKSCLVYQYKWQCFIFQGQQDMAFTVNHPNQIMMMGYSQDLGKCAGVSKAGKACTNFINKWVLCVSVCVKHEEYHREVWFNCIVIGCREQGQFCVYHVQSAYKKTCAKRTELQGRSVSVYQSYI